MNAVMVALVGLAMIGLAIYQQMNQPTPQIEYRYVPRTFSQDQDNPVLVSQLFSNMFSEPSLWVGGFDIDGNVSKHRAINRYFITQ